jgi:hypothetical protein
MRKIMIEKEKVMLVGDKTGTLDPEKRARNGGSSHGEYNPSTPFHTAETPRNLGGETPRLGSELELGLGLGIC